MEKLVERIGADKLMWGSDHPFEMLHYTYRQCLDQIRRLRQRIERRGHSRHNGREHDPRHGPAGRTGRTIMRILLVRLRVCGHHHPRQGVIPLGRRGDGRRLRPLPRPLEDSQRHRPLAHRHRQLHEAEDEQEGLLALAPKVKEQMQRHSLYYHIQPGAFRKGHEEEQGFYSDYLAVGMHIEDSVYGPLYFDYGADGQPGARSIVKKTVERALLEAAPDFVLVLMEASQDTIRSRMKADPHPPAGRSGGRRRARLARFREEYELSTIPNRLTLDTTSATVEETLAEFAGKIQPFLSSDDTERRERHKCRSQT